MGTMVESVVHSLQMMPSKGFFGNRDFRGTGEQRPNFEGNWGTKTILGNREHLKTIFD